jgi:predicted phosphodiesterase
MSLESLKEFATERQCQVIDAIVEHGSQNKAAKALDINLRTLERSLQAVKRQAARRGWSPDHDMNKPCPDTHVIKGVSTFYDENGKPIRQWVKSDLKKQSQEDALQSFADALIEDLPKYKPLPYQSVKDLPEHLTAYVIGDAHIGMKVTKERNGDADWDLEIAERVTVGAIEKLIHASGGSDTGLMLDLGDFGHSDNLANTTSSGQNHMDMDGDYGDSIAAQLRIYRRSIDLLLKSHNKVILMQVRGNHNSSTSRCMNIMLKAFYENEPRVQVLDNAHKFQHITYGNNLLVTHHGDRMKAQRAFEYTARSLSKEWGQCEHKHLLMGHVHHHTAVEIGGMLCETFQALPAGDAWHSDSGYGAKRSMSAVVYDKEHGEIQRHKVGIGQLS